jgi:DNA-binding transcriptional LysR family regulator
LSIAAGYSFGYDQWLREICQRFGGFEPDIAASADSPDSLIGMVAAGRGVFLGPEVAIRGTQGPWTSAGNLYLLNEPESHFELFAIWKRKCPMEPTVSKFLDVLEKELGSAPVRQDENGANLDRASVNHSRHNDLTPDSTVRNEFSAPSQ